MRKYEYLTYNMSATEMNDDLQGHLNEKGEEGWKLVNIERLSTQDIRWGFVFMRRKIDTSLEM